MAVAPTGAIYKSLIFDGEDSRDYGVYITGEAVYNAPERDVQMISIPGRSGAFALDNGRFENIEVIYPAGIFADDETDFAEAISDFRNFLCSKKGYCRLEDEYNPDEYRMAVYKSGLEVSPAQMKAGEFEIIFECKPQRWLKSGETAITVTSGDTITNPTLFEASPLLEVEGYGTLNVNGTEIEIDDDLVGDVEIPSASSSSLPFDIALPEIYAVMDDAVEINDAYMNFRFRHKDSSYTQYYGSSSIQSWSGYADAAPQILSAGTSQSVRINFTTPWPIDYGRSEIRSVYCTARLCFRKNNTDYYYNVTITATIGYSPGSNTITLRYSLNSIDSKLELSGVTGAIGGGTIHSTATTFGHPTYIDCDLGEAYADDSGVISSLNSYIALGSKLPTLAVGSTEITFDNTITDLKVVPRWWKI